MENNIILEYLKVSYGYREEEVIFNDISFQIGNQEVVVIIGSSGRGKSTLLKLANRLIDPVSGEIQYCGRDVKSLNPLQLRKEIGYIPQIPYLIEGSVKDNLLLPFDQKEIPENIDEIFYQKLKEVGLSHESLSRPYEKLSVGEKQRVALARSLLNNSKLLLLDEPTSALDEENTLLLINSLKRVVEEELVSLLIVTHQLDFAKRIGDRYLYLDGKGLREVDDPRNAFLKEES